MEEAANELINMLLEFDHNQREEVEKFEEESCTESKTIDHNDSEGMLIASFHDQTQYSVKKAVQKFLKERGLPFLGPCCFYFYYNADLFKVKCC